MKKAKQVHLAVFQVALALLASSSPAVWGQASYPSRPIRLVVPNAAGGPSDTLARILGQKMGENMGQAVVVDNRVGAAGNIGTDFVAKSAPDGYTMLLTTSGPISINPNLYKMTYDPIKDLAPITIPANTYLLLMVNPKLEVNSVSELVQLAKRRPGQLNYASTGVGNNQHLAFEMLKAQAGIDVVHVPFRALTQIIPAVIAGDVSMMLDTMGGMAQARTGRLKALAVTGKKRSSFAPDIPTLAESGFPSYDVTLWFGLFAPGGTSPELVSRLNAESNKVVNSADARPALNSAGVEPVGSSSQELTAQIASEMVTWAKLIKSLGIKPE